MSRSRKRPVRAFPAAAVMGAPKSGIRPLLQFEGPVLPLLLRELWKNAMLTL